MKLSDNPRAYAIMGCAMRVHKTLGPGFLESAYGDALEIEFARAGIPCVREDEVRVFYDGQPLKTAYRADFTCFDRSYIVELKAIRSLSKIEWAQVIHYMRATKIRFSLLVNFGRAQLQYETFDLERLSTVPKQEINWYTLSRAFVGKSGGGPSRPHKPDLPTTNGKDEEEQELPQIPFATFPCPAHVRA